MTTAPRGSTQPPPAAGPAAWAGVGAGRPADSSSALGRLAYRLLLDLSTAWMGRRHRQALGGVERFCLFVGTPRSGHSIVGALVNAHPDAVISHELDAPELIRRGTTREELFARILARAWWFHLRGNTTNYDYSVPGACQGRFRRLRVIGDKRAGSVTRAIAADPGFLDRVQEMVGAPLGLLHVVRNPFDNISAISLWHGLSLEESVELYFDHCGTNREVLGSGVPVLTLRHEELIEDSRKTLRRICTFYGLEAPGGYLDAAARAVFARPTRTALRVPWPAELAREVVRRMGEIPFLAGYELAVPPPPPPVPAGARAVSATPGARRRPTPHGQMTGVPGPAAAKGTAAYWDRVTVEALRAAPLDAWRSYMRALYLDLVARWLPESPTSRTLKTDLFEEAVSPAHLLPDLGPGALGLDRSLVVVAAAARRLAGTPGRHPLLVADLRQLPLRAASVERILSGSSLDHFEDPSDLAGGLQELSRVLAPGGIMALVLDNRHNPVVWLRNRLPFPLLHALRLVPYYVGATCTRPEALELLEGLGLEVTESAVVAHAPRAPAIWLISLLEGWGRAGLAHRVARWFLRWERLGHWPSRYRTGYYLAFQGRRGARPPAPPAG